MYVASSKHSSPHMRKLAISDLVAAAAGGGGVERHDLVDPVGDEDGHAHGASALRTQRAAYPQRRVRARPLSANSTSRARVTSRAKVRKSARPGPAAAVARPRSSSRTHMQLSTAFVAPADANLVQSARILDTSAGGGVGMVARLRREALEAGRVAAAAARRLHNAQLVGGLIDQEAYEYEHEEERLATHNERENPNANSYSRVVAQEHVALLQQQLLDERRARRAMEIAVLGGNRQRPGSRPHDEQSQSTAPKLVAPHVGSWLLETPSENEQHLVPAVRPQMAAAWAEATEYSLPQNSGQDYMEHPAPDAAVDEATRSCNRQSNHRKPPKSKKSRKMRKKRESSRRRRSASTRPQSEVKVRRKPENDEILEQAGEVKGKIDVFSSTNQQQADKPERHARVEGRAGLQGVRADAESLSKDCDKAVKTKTIATKEGGRTGTWDYSAEFIVTENWRDRARAEGHHYLLMTYGGRLELTEERSVNIMQKAVRNWLFWRLIVRIKAARKIQRSWRRMRDMKHFFVVTAVPSHTAFATWRRDWSSQIGHMWPPPMKAMPACALAASGGRLRRFRPLHRRFFKPRRLVNWRIFVDNVGALLRDAHATAVAAVTAAEAGMLCDDTGLASRFVVAAARTALISGAVAEARRAAIPPSKRPKKSEQSKTSVKLLSTDTAEGMSNMNVANASSAEALSRAVSNRDAHSRALASFWSEWCELPVAAATKKRARTVTWWYNKRTGDGQWNRPTPPRPEHESGLGLREPLQSQRPLPHGGSVLMWTRTWVEAWISARTKEAKELVRQAERQRRITARRTQRAQHALRKEAMRQKELLAIARDRKRELGFNMEEPPADEAWREATESARRTLASGGTALQQELGCVGISWLEIECVCEFNEFNNSVNSIYGVSGSESEFEEAARSQCSGSDTVMDASRLVNASCNMETEVIRDTSPQIDSTPGSDSQSELHENLSVNQFFEMLLASPLALGDGNAQETRSQRRRGTGAMPSTDKLRAIPGVLWASAHEAAQLAYLRGRFCAEIWEERATRAQPALQIQCWLRRHHARRVLEVLRIEHAARCTISYHGLRFWRGYLGRRRVRRIREAWHDWYEALWANPEFTDSGRRDPQGMLIKVFLMNAAAEAQIEEEVWLQRIQQEARLEYKNAQRKKYAHNIARRSRRLHTAIVRLNLCQEREGGKVLSGDGAPHAESDSDHDLFKKLKGEERKHIVEIYPRTPFPVRDRDGRLPPPDFGVDVRVYDPLTSAEWRFVLSEEELREAIEPFISVLDSQQAGAAINSGFGAQLAGSNRSEFIASDFGGDEVSARAANAYMLARREMLVAARLRAKFVRLVWAIPPPLSPDAAARRAALEAARGEPFSLDPDNKAQAGRHRFVNHLSPDELWEPHHLDILAGRFSYRWERSQFPAVRKVVLRKKMSFDELEVGRLCYRQLGSDGHGNSVIISIYMTADQNPYDSSSLKVEPEGSLNSAGMSEGLSVDFSVRTYDPITCSSLRLAVASGELLRIMRADPDLVRARNRMLSTMGLRCARCGLATAMAMETVLVKAQAGDQTDSCSQKAVAARDRDAAATEGNTCFSDDVLEALVALKAAGPCMCPPAKRDPMQQQQTCSKPGINLSVEQLLLKRNRPYLLRYIASQLYVCKGDDVRFIDPLAYLENGEALCFGKSLMDRKLADRRTTSIQCAFRCHLSRAVARKLTHGCFVKEYNADAGQFYYRRVYAHMRVPVSDAECRGIKAGRMKTSLRGNYERSRAPVSESEAQDSVGEEVMEVMHISTSHMQWRVPYALRARRNPGAKQRWLGDDIKPIEGWQRRWFQPPAAPREIRPPRVPFYFDALSGRTSWLTESQAAAVVQRAFRHHRTQHLIMHSVSEGTTALKVQSTAYERFKSRPDRIAAQVNWALALHTGFCASRTSAGGGAPRERAAMRMYRVILTSGSGMMGNGEITVHPRKTHPVPAIACALLMIKRRKGVPAITKVRAKSMLFVALRSNAAHVQFERVRRLVFWHRLVLNPYSPHALVNWALVLQYIDCDYPEAFLYYRRALGAISVVPSWAGHEPPPPKSAVSALAPNLNCTSEGESKQGPIVQHLGEWEGGEIAEYKHIKRHARRRARKKLLAVRNRHQGSEKRLCEMSWLSWQSDWRHYAQKKIAQERERARQNDDVKKSAIVRMGNAEVKEALEQSSDPVWGWCCEGSSSDEDMDSDEGHDGETDDGSSSSGGDEDNANSDTDESNFSEPGWDGTLLDAMGKLPAIDKDSMSHMSSRERTREKARRSAINARRQLLRRRRRWWRARAMVIEHFDDFVTEHGEGGQPSTVPDGCAHSETQTDLKWTPHQQISDEGLTPWVQPTLMGKEALGTAARDEAARLREEQQMRGHHTALESGDDRTSEKDFSGTATQYAQQWANAQALLPAALRGWLRWSFVKSDVHGCGELSRAELFSMVSRKSSASAAFDVVAKDSATKVRPVAATMLALFETPGQSEYGDEEQREYESRVFVNELFELLRARSQAEAEAKAAAEARKEEEETGIATVPEYVRVPHATHMRCEDFVAFALTALKAAATARAACGVRQLNSTDTCNIISAAAECKEADLNGTDDSKRALPHRVSSAAKSCVLPAAAEKYHQHWCQLNAEAFGEPSVDNIGGRTFWLNKLTGELRWQMPPIHSSLQNPQKKYDILRKVEPTLMASMVESVPDQEVQLIHDDSTIGKGQKQANLHELRLNEPPKSNSKICDMQSNGIQKHALGAESKLLHDDQALSNSSSSQCSPQSDTASGAEEELLSAYLCEGQTSAKDIDDGGWLGENPHRVTNAGWGQHIHAQDTPLEPMPLDAALAYAVAAANAAAIAAERASMAAFQAIHSEKAKLASQRRELDQERAKARGRGRGSGCGRGQGHTKVDRQTSVATKHESEAQERTCKQDCGANGSPPCSPVVGQNQGSETRTNMDSSDKSSDRPHREELSEAALISSFDLWLVAHAALAATVVAAAAADAAATAAKVASQAAQDAPKQRVRLIEAVKARECAAAVAKMAARDALTAAIIAACSSAIVCARSAAACAAAWELDAREAAADAPVRHELLMHQAAIDRVRAQNRTREAAAKAATVAAEAAAKAAAVRSAAMSHAAIARYNSTATRLTFFITHDAISTWDSDPNSGTASEGMPIGVAGVCHANATCRLAALADAKLAVAAKNHGKAQLIEDRAELGMSVLGTSAVETCPLFSIRACESKAPAPTHAPSWKLAPALAPGPAAIIGRAGARTRVPSTLRLRIVAAALPPNRRWLTTPATLADETRAGAAAGSCDGGGAQRRAVVVLAVWRQKQRPGNLLSSPRMQTTSTNSSVAPSSKPICPSVACTSLKEIGRTGVAVFESRSVMDGRANEDGAAIMTCDDGTGACLPLPDSCSTPGGDEGLELHIEVYGSPGGDPCTGRVADIIPFDGMLEPDPDYRPDGGDAAQKFWGLCTPSTDKSLAQPLAAEPPEHLSVNESVVFEEVPLTSQERALKTSRTPSRRSSQKSTSAKMSATADAITARQRSRWHGVVGGLTLLGGAVIRGAQLDRALADGAHGKPTTWELAPGRHAGERACTARPLRLPSAGGTVLLRADCIRSCNCGCACDCVQDTPGAKELLLTSRRRGRGGGREDTSVAAQAKKRWENWLPPVRAAQLCELAAKGACAAAVAGVRSGPVWAPNEGHGDEDETASHNQNTFNKYWGQGAGAPTVSLLLQPEPTTGRLVLGDVRMQLSDAQTQSSAYGIEQNSNAESDRQLYMYAIASKGGVIIGRTAAEPLLPLATTLHMQHKQAGAFKEQIDEYCSDDEQPLTASGGGGRFLCRLGCASIEYTSEALTAAARSHDAIVADASELQRRATDAVTAAQRAANWSEKQDHDALRARHIKAARFAAEAKKKARDKANEEAELEGQKEAIRAANASQARQARWEAGQAWFYEDRKRASRERAQKEADEHQQERAKTCAKLRALGLSESSGRESTTTKKNPAGKRMDTMIMSDGSSDDINEKQPQLAQMHSNDMVATPSPACASNVEPRLQFSFAQTWGRGKLAAWMASSAATAAEQEEEVALVAAEVARKERDQWLEKRDELRSALNEMHRKARERADFDRASGLGPLATAEAEGQAADEEQRLRKQLAIIESQESAVLQPLMPAADIAAAAAAAATMAIREAAEARLRADEAASRHGTGDVVAKLLKHAAEAERDATRAAQEAEAAAAAVPVPDSARWLRMINLLSHFDGPTLLRATSIALQQAGLDATDMALLKRGLATEEHRLNELVQDKTRATQTAAKAAQENAKELAKLDA